MKREIFLKTNRIGFSKWTHEDLELAKTLWGNPEVTKYICANGIFSEDDIQSRLNLEIENETNHRIQYWPIFELDLQEFIGCCGLRPYMDGGFEIGFHLRPEFWKHGYATEAANAVIEYAFNVLNAKALYAGHNPANIASKLTINKLGFDYLGDELYVPTGLYHPTYILRKRVKG